MNSIDAKSILRFAYYVFSVAMIYVTAATFVKLPESGEDTAKYVTGFLIGTGFASIVGYYFGGAIKKLNTEPPKPEEPKKE